MLSRISSFRGLWSIGVQRRQKFRKCYLRICFEGSHDWSQIDVASKVAKNASTAPLSIVPSSLVKHSTLVLTKERETSLPSR